jgi:hypothetical protein
MIKNCLFAVALLSLALAGGCAKGGNGTGNGISVAISDAGNLSVFYVTQVEQFTAKVTGTSNTAVTWSLSGTACTGSGNPCGTIDANGKYTAPANAPNPAQVTVTATSQADTTKSDSRAVTIKQITVRITPTPANVRVGLTQQFTAVALPDDAPQIFTWTIQNCTGNCGSIDPNTGLYTAPSAVPTPATFSVQAAVPPSLDPSGFNQADATIVKSRLGSSKQATTYAFRFSGFNITGATALAGNFVVATDGQTITSGVEDELTTAGWTPRTLTGFYTPTSNNQGKITLNPSGTSSNTYTVVLDANGDIQMIESDSTGTGSGVIEQVAAPSKFNTATLVGSFVLGFTGVDYLQDKRVGYAAFLPMDGAGNIGMAGGGSTPGLIDINDGGTASTAGDVTGSYSMTNGIGSMTISSVTLNKTFNFNLYAVSGTTKASNPLTVYAISTDTSTNPAVSGTVVFQDPGGAPYNNATFKSSSVVDLTGVDSTGTQSNVSLTLVSTDGSGNLSGSFDQNNAGTILSVSSFSTGYKYSATGSGRYTFQLLGDPTAKTVVPPLPFVLYASGANRGFLLECNLQPPACGSNPNTDTSVMTGTMNPQMKSHIYAASDIPSTYAAATTSSGTSGVCPLAANLLLTWVNPTQGVSGTQYGVQNATQCDASGSVTLTGAYTLNGPGNGTITLTAPAAQSYVIYAIDVSHFLMMDVDKANPNPSIIFAQQ